MKKLKKLTRYVIGFREDGIKKRYVQDFQRKSRAIKERKKLKKDFPNVRFTIRKWKVNPWRARRKR